MYYKIKKNDNLKKISKKFSIPVELLFAFNKEIKNLDHFYENQLIYIPNTDDIPNKSLQFQTKNANDLIIRARTAIDKGIRYRLGSGGMKPELQSPTSDNFCDCSGFVCWVLGISRKTTSSFYEKFGGWIYTDSMVADINSSAGIFEKLNTPEVGCIIVYGAGNKIGHVGIVSEVDNGKMSKVIHCSKGNDTNYNDSIKETNPSGFNRIDSLWGRFTDVI